MRIVSAVSIAIYATAPCIVGTPFLVGLMSGPGLSKIHRRLEMYNPATIITRLITHASIYCIAFLQR